MREMQRLGPPRLRGHVLPCGTVLLAEGTHRIRASSALGLSPTIVAIPWWRSAKALDAARFAAARRGLSFSSLEVLRG